MGHTNLRDVQYGKVSIEYAIRVYYGTVFYAIWGVPIFDQKWT